MAKADMLIYETKKRIMAKFPRFGTELANANITYRDNLRYKTAATDGKNVFIDPDYFASLSQDDRTFLVAHEFMHNKFKHMFRFRDKNGQMKNHDVWNYACDAIINANLEREGFTIDEKYVNRPEALKYTAEEFYDILMKEQQNQQQNKQQNKQQDKQQNKQQKKQQDQQENGGSQGEQKDQDQSQGDGQGNQSQQDNDQNSSNNGQNNQDDQNNNQSENGQSKQQDNSNNDQNGNQSNDQNTDDQNNQNDSDNTQGQNGQESDINDKSQSQSQSSSGKSQQDQGQNSSQQGQNNQDQQANQNGSQGQQNDNPSKSCWGDKKPVGDHSMWEDVFKEYEDEKNKENNNSNGKTSKKQDELEGEKNQKETSSNGKNSEEDKDQKQDGESKDKDQGQEKDKGEDQSSDDQKQEDQGDKSKSNKNSKTNDQSENDKDDKDVDNSQDSNSDSNSHANTEKGKNNQDKNQFGDNSDDGKEDYPDEHTSGRSMGKGKGGDNKNTQKVFKNGYEESNEEFDIDEKNEFEKNHKERKERIRKQIEKTKLGQTNEGLKNLEKLGTKVGDLGKEKPILDWRMLLKREFDKDNDLWTQRRSVAENNYAYRLEEYEEEDESVTEIVVDTSGSVGLNLIKNFLRQTKSIMSHSKLRVGEFNYNFYGFQDIKTEKDIDNIELNMGGGTNFDAASRAFSHDPKVNKICFTDGEDYGDAGIEEIRDDIIWICWGNRNFQPDNGKVIFVSQKDFEKLNNNAVVNNVITYIQDKNSAQGMDDNIVENESDNSFEM